MEALLEELQREVRYHRRGPLENVLRGKPITRQEFWLRRDEARDIAQRALYDRDVSDTECRQLHLVAELWQCVSAPKED